MQRKIPAWGNPIIRVDLTAGTITREVVSEDLRRKFIGGRGINDWLLYSMVDPGATDPLSPANVMVFGTGLLEGCAEKTLVPGALRLTVSFLNAFSGGYGESSSAGLLATELRRSGYDHIVICGRSDKPVYLWINDGHVELKDATALRGKSTFEADEAIKAELGDSHIKTCTIGPAGERLVRYALLNVTDRYCGRCGGGAVMGSKNLKAIAVRGTGSVELVDPDKAAQIADKVTKLLENDEGIKWLAERGMAGTPEVYNEVGIQGVKNYLEVGFESISEVGYDAVKKYYKEVLPCINCPVCCDRLVEIPENEPYGGTRVSSLQATPAYNFAKFLIDDINTVIKGFELCNGLGIDIHSFSEVGQWAVECYERGILTKEDTDKLELRWGDGPLVLEMIRRAAYREGRLGNLLADGVYFASKRIGRGSEKYAMQMKKMEVDDELRVCKGWALGIITDPRGPTHTLGAFTGEMKGFTREQAKRIFGNENVGEAQNYEGKAEMVAENERIRVIQDCLGLCYFATHKSVALISREYNMCPDLERIQYGDVC
jgi:aldehyde:ferredoxin oxidoreductase